MARGRGFTLIELMVTIFVAAILIAVAVPSFQHVVASSRLTSSANSMVNAINVARMAAIKSNGGVQLCGSANNGADTLGLACQGHAGAVFALTTSPAGNSTVVQVHAATAVAGGSQHVVGGIIPMRFDAQGMAHQAGNSAPYTGAVTDICTTALGSDNHRHISLITGTIIDVTRHTGICQ